ncbi:MAG: hypothetical protein NTX17_00700 [Candidatus Eisenbacteria bacterium]|nr:hypothetical protein [Candidatus Eisenbacteria bacterium]
MMYEGPTIREGSTLIKMRGKGAVLFNLLRGKKANGKLARIHAQIHTKASGIQERPYA